MLNVAERTKKMGWRIARKIDNVEVFVDLDNSYIEVWRRLQGHDYNGFKRELRTVTGKNK